MTGTDDVTIVISQTQLSDGIVNIKKITVQTTGDIKHLATLSDFLKVLNNKQEIHEDNNHG